MIFQKINSVATVWGGDLNLAFNPQFFLLSFYYSFYIYLFFIDSALCRSRFVVGELAWPSQNCDLDPRPAPSSRIEMQTLSQ